MRMSLSSARSKRNSNNKRFEASEGSQRLSTPQSFRTNDSVELASFSPPPSATISPTIVSTSITTTAGKKMDEEVEEQMSCYQGGSIKAPSSFWKRGPPTRELSYDYPSPSTSAHGFEGYFPDYPGFESPTAPSVEHPTTADESPQEEEGSGTCDEFEDLIFDFEP